MESSQIRLLLVDDHALIRSIVKRLLESAKDMEVIGEASDANQALHMIRELHPDIVLLDICMPGLDGLETTLRIRRVKPTPKIIILSSLEHEPFPSQLLKAGAASYLTKSVSQEEMIKTIRITHSGERYLPPELAQRLVEQGLAGSLPFDKLTARELEIVLLISRGIKVGEIAKKLFLSSKTINTYRYRIYKKLNIHNDVELTHMAMQHGLVEVHEKG